jgi:hypothetical protein
MRFFHLWENCKKVSGYRRSAMDFLGSLSLKSSISKNNFFVNKLSVRFALYLIKRKQILRKVTLCQIPGQFLLYIRICGRNLVIYSAEYSIKMFPLFLRKYTNKFWWKIPLYVRGIFSLEFCIYFCQRQ